MDKIIACLLLVACTSQKASPTSNDNLFSIDVILPQDEGIITDEPDKYQEIDLSLDLLDSSGDYLSPPTDEIGSLSADDGFIQEDVGEGISEEATGTRDEGMIAQDQGVETEKDSKPEEDLSKDSTLPHFCGDGHCDEDEDCRTCDVDCGVCPAVCGDGICEGAEDCSTCPQDCGICFCGDGWCSELENCVLCPLDCGSCPPPCNDGTCAIGETCWLCPEDCGVCPIDCLECIPKLYFGAYFEETLSKAIVAGRQLSIFYEPDRLWQCRGQGATIELFYVFPPSTEQQSVVVASFSPLTGQFEAMERTISIPLDASKVVFWAKNRDSTGCEAWDSDYGKNYTFPVFSATQLMSPITWAGNFQFVWITEGGVIYKGDVDPAYFFESMLGSELITAVQVQVYMPGVTDTDFSSEVLEQVAKTAIKAVIVTDAYPLSYGEKKVFPLNYVGRGGLDNHDFIYRFTPTRYEWFLLPDGAYHYRIEVSMVESTEKIVFGNPSDSTKDRVFVIAHHPRCDLFPYNPPPEYCGE